MQTASRFAEAERHRSLAAGPNTRVSRTLTLAQWASLSAAVKMVVADFQRASLAFPAQRHRIFREQAAEAAADLVRVLHELERQ